MRKGNLASVSPLRPKHGERKMVLKCKHRQESSFQKRRRERKNNANGEVLMGSAAGERLKSMAFPSETLATATDFSSGGSSRVRSSQLTVVREILKRKGGIGPADGDEGVEVAETICMDPWVSQEFE